MLSMVSNDPGRPARAAVQAAQQKLREDDADGAEAELRAALQALEDAGASESPDGALVQMGLGAVGLTRKDLEAAAAAFERARGIHEAARTLETSDGADALQAVGDLRLEQERPAEAAEALGEALRVRKALESLETPKGVALWTSIAMLRKLQGNIEDATFAVGEARRIQGALAADTSRPPDSARVRMLWEDWQESEDPEKAKKPRSEDLQRLLDAYEEEREHRVSKGTMETPEGVQLVTNIGLLRRMQGDVQGTEAAVIEAKALNEGVETQKSLGAGGRRNAVVGDMGMPKNLAGGSALQALRQARRLENKALAMGATPPISPSGGSNAGGGGYGGGSVSPADPMSPTGGGGGYGRQRRAGFSGSLPLAGFSGSLPLAPTADMLAAQKE